MPGDRLNMLQAQLERIHGRVRQLVLDALGEAKAPGANEAAPMLAEARSTALELKLRPILNDLALVYRELRTISDTLDFRERIAVRIPREFRFRERQSIVSRRHRHGQVFQLMTDIIEDLRTIWGGRGPSDRELTDAATDAVNSGVEFCQKLTSSMNEFRTVLGSPQGPTITAGGPMATVQNASFEVLALLAWLITYAILRRSKLR